MILLYCRLQLLEATLAVFLSGADLLVSGKDLDNPQILSFPEQTSDHTLADRAGIKIPLREHRFKSLDQIVDTLTILSASPKGQD